MSKPAQPSASWSQANRLLGDLAASVGSGVAARLGGDDDAGDWEERAAIMEYDGGLPREAAQAFAREGAALGPNPSPKALAALDARLWAFDLRHKSAAQRP